jgi:23S rRNA pseudouridine2605 synthase
MPEERLQKIIATAGIASRRKAEELITQGRVSVNGHIASELGTKADPDRDRITVDGKPLRIPEQHVYLLLNKPRGYVSTVSDPEGRPTVMDLVKSVRARVFPVGRLDYASEGLLLLTNDGELTQKLTHASSHVPKTYLVKISGRPTEEAIEKLRRGIRIGGAADPKFRARLKAVTTAPAQIKLFREGENPWYEITLIEGRNRQIRRMFEQVGHNVEKIKRVRYGSLELDVEPGQFRHLTPAEVSALRRGRPARPEAASSLRSRRRSDFGSDRSARRGKKNFRR